jgi:hypothetical protein
MAMSWHAFSLCLLCLNDADVEPPANWTSNWLPAPAGGGPLEWNCELTYVSQILDDTGINHSEVVWR